MQSRKIGVLLGASRASARFPCARARPCSRPSRDRGPRRRPHLRRPRRRCRPPPGADRRRVHRAPRPLGRGRLHPGPARAARHPVHRLRRDGVRARDAQGQGQGAVPPAQPADARVLHARRGRPAATLAEHARRLRLPVRRQADPRGQLGRRHDLSHRSRSSRPASRRRCASTTRSSSSASSPAGGLGRDPRRPRARRRRDRAARGLLRLREQVHARRDRLLRAAAPVARALPRRARPGAARAPRARLPRRDARRHDGLASRATSSSSRSTRSRA